MAGTLVVAAVSARLLAEAAAHEGWRVVAIDAFGDADTRTAAALWLPLARPGRMSPDTDLTLAALRHCAAREPGVIGWIAGAGFDGAPAWLDEAARTLPLLGTAPAALRALRDPAQWLAALQRLAIPHPPSALALPADRRGWLVKDLHGSGGWEVRDARSANWPARRCRCCSWPVRPACGLWAASGC
jgi:predicted ATP-grasp superfamily ATP-dependent carboligase